MRVPYESLGRTIPLDDASVRAWLDAHAEEVDRAVAENAQRYVQLEPQRRASHVLVAVAEDADAATVAAARRRAQAVLRRARAGEDFVALARELSDDEGSAIRGGELGWSARGRYVDEIDEALFAARRPGVLAQLVRTRFGFHVVVVTGVHEGGDLPAAEVRADQERELYFASMGLERLRPLVEQAIAHASSADALVAAVEASLPAPHPPITSARLAPFEEGDRFVPDLGGQLTASRLLGLAPGQWSPPIAAPGAALVFLGEGTEPLPEGRTRCLEPSADVFMHLFVLQQPPEEVEEGQSEEGQSEEGELEEGELEEGELEEGQSEQGQSQER